MPKVKRRSAVRISRPMNDSISPSPAAASPFATEPRMIVPIAQHSPGREQQVLGRADARDDARNQRQHRDEHGDAKVDPSADAVADAASAVRAIPSALG